MTKKIILIAVILIVVIPCVIWFALTLFFLPTPDAMRNLSTTDVKIMVGFPASEERKAITRTYTKEEFESFSASKMDKIKEDVSGNIEGDIPCLDLEDEKGVLKFSFQTSEGLCLPDSKPSIQIDVRESPWSDEEGRIIKDELSMGEDGLYFYEMHRYRTQYEKLFMEFSLIEVTYKIHGKEYISLFAINADNAENGVDFFENETLDEPKAAEF